MKLSEYREARDAHWRECGRSDTLETLVDRDVRAAEAAGVTWDPEEPEVLWESGRYRLLKDGAWEVQIGDRSPIWQPSVDAGEGVHAPLFEELARRLLEERRQQEAVDSWNDKQAQAAEREADAIGKTLNPPEPLPGKLEILEEEDGLTFSPILMEGGAFRLDLSDTDLSPKEERLLRAMVDCWNAWGEQGELRQKLADFRPVRFEKGGGWLLPDIKQLHAELLARPWSES